MVFLDNNLISLFPVLFFLFCFVFQVLPTFLGLFEPWNNFRLYQKLQKMNFYNRKQYFIINANFIDSSVETIW